MPYDINTNYSAKSFNQRIRFLVLHYTAENFDKSLKTLTEGEVSAHYLIPEEAVRNQRTIYRLVEESLRAWHAGISSWQGRTNINDTSIGIEIVNLGYKDEEGYRKWFPFNDYQIETAIELTRDIITRYDIHPTCIIGHGDIAPGRKVDPGPLFPWKKLYEHGIGAWYDVQSVNEAKEFLANKIIDIKWVQKNLKTYGYAVEETGILDEQTQEVLKAFQMHFRPANFSGTPDEETYAILDNLIKKYFPNQVLKLEDFIQSSAQQIVHPPLFQLKKLSS